MAILSPAAPLLPGGLLAPDPALETYMVRPGGVTVVAVGGEDRVRIVDRFGGQIAELTVLDAQGRERSDALGLHADVAATRLRELLRAGADEFLAELHRLGLAPHDARA